MGGLRYEEAETGSPNMKLAGDPIVWCGREHSTEASLIIKINLSGMVC